jgi:hypothetical protein
MPEANRVVLTVALGITLCASGITAQVAVPKRDRASSGRLSDGTKFEGSPHVGALRLVFQAQGEVIDRVDEGEWWLDTDVRNWIVRRVCGPGIMDTRHDFYVVYRISGRDAASWVVNTARKTVLQDRPPFPKLGPETELALDLGLLRNGRFVNPPADPPDWVSSAESLAAAARVFGRLNFVGLDRATVLWILGEESIGLSPAVEAEGPDAPLVYRFDLGGRGTQYVLEFRGGRVSAVRKEPLPKPEASGDRLPPDD